MKQLTIEEVLQDAPAFLASERRWDLRGQDRGQRPGRELYGKCIEALRGFLETGESRACFNVASEMLTDRSTSIGGPNGVYGIAHLCTAAWMDTQKRPEYRDRLIRLAKVDMESRP